MDKIELLYNSYIENGLLSKETTLEQFVNADDSIKESLYNSGVENKILSQDTDIDTFKSAWSEKKNLVENEQPQVDGESNSEVGSLESPNLDEEKGFWEDTWNELSANTKSALAGIAGVPNYINKSVFGLLAPEKVNEYTDKLEPKQREDFINGLFSMTGVPSTSVSGFLGEKGSESQEKLLERSKEIRSEMTQYDDTITESLGKGEWGEAGRRLGVGAIGTIPSIVQAIIPYVGLTSVAAGSASNKQEELEEEGEDLNISTLATSAIVGTVEGLFEKYTKGMGSKFFNALRGKGEKAVVEGVGGILKGLKDTGMGALGEGATEALQGANEKLTEYILLDKEQDFMDALSEISDQFLIGAVSGAGMSGATNVIQGVNNKRKEQGKSEIETDVEVDVEAEPDVETPDYLKIITREGVEQVDREFQEKIQYVNQQQEDGTIDSEEAQKATKMLEKARKKAVAQINLRTEQPTTDQPTIAVIKKKSGSYTDEISGNRIVKSKSGKWQVKGKNGKVLHEANTLKSATAFQEETNRENIIEEMRTPVQKADNLLVKGREEGKTDAEIIESIEDEAVKRTAKIRLRQEEQATLDPETARKRSKELAEKAREEQSKPDKQLLKAQERALMNAIDKFTDRQGSVKRLLKKSGIKKVGDYIVSKLGANAQAKRISERVDAKVFNGLSQENTRNLEEIILNKRIIALDKNRQERGMSLLDHQGGQTSESSKIALEGYRQKLGENTFNDLSKRADAFFNEYRNLLITMRNEGIISQSTYEEFAEVDYQPKKVIEFMKDMEGQFMPEELDQFESSTLSQDAIQSSTTGATESQVMDSRGLIQRSIMGRTKAVFANRVNKAFADEFVQAMSELKRIKDKVEKGEEVLTKDEAQRLPYLEELQRVAKMDRIVGFTESGNPKYANEGKTKGYKSLYYMIDGVRHRMLLREDFYSKFTDTGNQILGAAARNGLSIATGNRIVKALATGNNPLFFITNVPRDLAFVLTFSEAYGTNNLNVLQNNIVVQGLKLAKDFLKGYYSSVSRNELYDQYFEYGGGMDFLTLQGRYGKDGIFGKYINRKLKDAFFDLNNTLVAKSINGLMEGLRRFNTASEIATRLAIFERSQKNQLKALGKKSLDEVTSQEKEDILIKAIRQAREITDFNQGGKVTKAMDSAIPYLNAATQGTRSAVQNYQDRPVETTWRILQIAGVMGSALTYGAVALVGALRNEDEDDEEVRNMTDEQIYFETLKGVSEYDLKNYYIIPKGTKDSRGEWEYYRVAKAQSLSPFLAVTEHIIRDQIAQANDISYEQIPLGQKVLNTIDENILPISVNPLNTFGRIPAVDALVATMGIDSYTGNVLDWERGNIPPELEGRYNKNVEEFYKKIGDFASVSPIRMKSAVESFITTPSTNPYVGFGYAAGELVAADEKTDIVKQFGNAAMKRMKKSTSEYNRTAKLFNNVDDTVVDVYKKHLDVKNAVKQAVVAAKKSNDDKQIEAVLEQVLTDTPELLEDAVKWAKSEVDKKSFSPLVNELRFTRNKEVRAVIIARVFGDALMKSKDQVKLDAREERILKELSEANVIDKDVLNYYKKIVTGE